MTREEAIRIIEKDIQIDVRSCTNEEVYAFITALNMAISALREQEERSKGCEYCTDSKNIYEIKSPLHDSYNTDVYISEDALIVDIGCHSYGASKIKFCPMCGRRLEEV